MKGLFLILLGLSGATSFADPANRAHDFGIGVMVGDTTSITGKYWTRPNAAFDVAGGAAEDKEGWFQASYLWHVANVLGSGTQVQTELMPYAGFGAGVGFNREIDDVKYNNDYFLRLPIGLAWVPGRIPIDVFAEVAPTYTVDPEDVVYLSGNVGGRYYFE
jgi:hypothetical protein